MRVVRVSLLGLALAVNLAVGVLAIAEVLPWDLSHAEQRLARRFASRGLAYPPQEIALLAFKSEARLELWARAAERWAFVRSFLIRAASGRLGPKLREGDHQVPEGVYAVTALNPSSKYHLALRVGYPNAFEMARASEDGRARLGGDIMIHGGAVSDGCLPLGDPAIEEVFALVERIGTEPVRVVVSPVDLRRVDRGRAQAMVAQRPAWLGDLYASIATALEPFDLPTDDPPRIARRMRRGTGCRPWDAADCLRRCGTGDTPSCGRAGMMYAVGRGPEPDPSRAWPLLGRACEGGDMLGCAELARLYVDDDGPRRDAARAAALAETACERGSGHGCAVLARLCTDRLIYPRKVGDCTDAHVRRLRDAAVERLQGDCKGWSARDCTVLASIYEPDDLPTALRLAGGACDGGDARGCELLVELRGRQGAPASIAAR
jgi:TPR repeat protein